MCYMGERERVGVREIRQNLSVYLDRVRQGHALEITDRGQPVAILAPIPGRSSLTARLVAEGRATAPSRAAREVGAPPPAPVGALSISRVLDELREDRL
jgi:prevent-host-death family protein